MPGGPPREGGRPVDRDARGRARGRERRAGRPGQADRQGRPEHPVPAPRGHGGLRQRGRADRRRNRRVTEPSYQVKDLDGCEVVTESGEVLGILKDVYPTGGNDVFSVQGETREHLVPARKEV